MAKSVRSKLDPLASSLVELLSTLELSDLSLSFNLPLVSENELLPTHESFGVICDRQSAKLRVIGGLLGEHGLFVLCRVGHNVQHLIVIKLCLLEVIYAVRRYLCRHILLDKRRYPSDCPLLTLYIVAEVEIAAIVRTLLLEGLLAARPPLEDHILIIVT